MGWGSWVRKAPQANAAREPLGIDLNAGRARAAYGRVGRNKLFPLDDPLTDLDLAISLEKRAPEIGRSAVGVCRKLPHVLCTGYLPYLTQAQPEWKCGRHALTADSALSLVLERVATASNGHDGVAFAVPAYLSFAQVARLVLLGEKARLKVRGTVTAPLALAAERATHFLYGHSGEAAETPRPGRSISPTAVLIVDADDQALTATTIRMSEEEVRVAGAAHLLPIEDPSAVAAAVKEVTAS